MPYPKKISELSPETEFYSEAVLMQQRAEEYLAGFGWCRSIGRNSLYVNLGSKLCVFLYQVDNSQSPKDDKLWVIVGDLPSMYLDAYDLKTTKEVLLTYVDWADHWVTHVLAGKPLDGCYPFQIDASPELAALLAQRTAFIKSTIVVNLTDLKQRAL